MFYRVDYVLVTIAVGALIGYLAGQQLGTLGSRTTARAYYIALAVTVSVTVIAFAIAYVLNGPPYSAAVLGVTGTIGNLLFGAIWGIALRQRRLAVLQEPRVLDALRMVVAVTFVLAAIGKALNAHTMTTFFTQSGYSQTFLNFIVFAEAVGAVGVLAHPQRGSAERQHRRDQSAAAAVCHRFPTRHR